MRSWLWPVLCVCLTFSWARSAALSADGVYETPEQAAADADFAWQGEYVGEKLGMQVVALGQGQFNSVTYTGGLPGAGWDGSARLEEEADAAGIQQLIAQLKLKKADRRSPTLGAKPPQGSLVLFDGTAESVQQHWQPGAKLDGDLLQQGCTSRDKFEDFSLHIEFRLPFMPAARGQARGNSGIYFQGRFEAQMLDSFGLEGQDNECGGLYTIKAPDVNMCFPPLAWQTYDVEFTAARYDNAGQKISHAQVTVRHNGVVIHRDVELPTSTRAAPLAEGPEAGPIYLQDHGNAVRYRNLWVLPRNAQQEARRPIVPGFERFHGLAGGDEVAGGQLLLGELNCIACHRAEGPLAAHLLPRKAPVLDEVGRRVQADYLLRFLTDPHEVKPGTTMPHVLAALPEEQRAAAASALVNFLVSTAEPPQTHGDNQAAKNGDRLFHEIGCTACHASRRDNQPVNLATTVPLAGLGDKYTIGSLMAFLQDPHKVRPSGRMPAFNLDGNGPRDLACFLIGDTKVLPKNPNLKFKSYAGSWASVPDFGELTPLEMGECAGLDLNVAGRTNDFGVRFDGFFTAKGAGEYTFHLGSDDGSLLFIDGKKVADSDGVHPHTVNSGKALLTKGVHTVRVDYIQGGGEWTLELEVEGPGLPRQDAARLLSMTEAGNPPPPPPPPGSKPPFTFNPDQVAQGRELFASLGCANCHDMKQNGQPIVSKLMPKPLKELHADQGCLAMEPAGVLGLDGPIPRFDLNAPQRAALVAALSAATTDQEPSPQQQIAHTLAAFNCYACHARANVGGPERERNPLFVSAIPEMGDEGRVPPPLDGVGDKLNDDWLRHVLQNGATDRPYMHARMPKFGLQNVGHLVPALIAADRQPEEPAPTLPEPENKAKATGRLLVGDKALGCIKCHTFGQHRATGIQALNMQTMTRRLREDWFLRYMYNPQAYRPGTRMPTGFPNGQALVKDVYDGNPREQLAAVWTYLKDGDRAGLPEGLIANVIELKPDSEPILYRNFIDGLTRGIAVGYPEKAHLAWDANQFNLAFIWQGRFIDAGLHWQGRGNGFQRPLGDNIVRLEESAPLAKLESLQAEWPQESAKERGYKFLGYQTDKQGRPRFKYAADGYTVEDFCQPVPKDSGTGFKRTLALSAASDVKNVYFRLVGKKIERQENGSFLLNELVRIRLSAGGATPTLRQAGDNVELLLPVTFTNGTAEIVEEIAW
ncbi:MAG: family 16 glycoside hydrolase [Pirellulales bacterium]